MNGWPELGDQLPRRGSAFFARIARGVLRVFGWQLPGEFPNCRKLVIIAAPHESNWDFVLAMLVLFSLRLRMNWLGKHTLFRGLAGAPMRWLGGIPVDRTAPGGVVEQAAERIRQADQFVLAIAPEGTRSLVEGFKSGFYHIARAAEVPILPVRVDYANRRLVLMDTVTPIDDAERGLAEIQALFPHLDAQRLAGPGGTA